jgi:hypothetical protein
LGVVVAVVMGRMQVPQAVAAAGADMGPMVVLEHPGRAITVGMVLSPRGKEGVEVEQMGLV